MASPSPPHNLGAELLAQLRDARSPLGRIRVVARAWRVMRNLSREERLTIAAQIGIDGADDLVEAIAAHQGTTPPADLMGTINNLQKVDPATLKSLATKMRDPRQRNQAVGKGLKAMESALIGPEAKPAPPKAVPPPPPPKPPAPPVTVKPATSWPLRESIPAPPKPAAPPPAAAPAPPPPAPPAPAPAAPPPPVEARPQEPPKPAPAPPPPAPVKPPEPVREPAAPSRSALAEALAALPVLTARFRLLRRRIGEVRRLSLADLRGVLEAFPDGWARRRALVDLIEAGAPERTADALSLLDALHSPGDRSWCLGTLADTRKLSADERAALLQAAPTPAGRRRLELRLAET